MFCDVARLRSFSQAARAHNVTQSAVSQLVSQIEARLDVQLIDRSVRPLQLTTLGQLYYDGCRNLIERFTELEARIRNQEGQLAGRVCVAAIYSVGLGDMEDYIHLFYQEQPTADVHIDYLHPDQVYEKVRLGNADFGLVSFPHASRELSVIPWREEEMVFVCAPRHRLARKSSVKPSDLDGERYVGFTRELVIRRNVDRFLRDHDVVIEVAREFDNIEHIKKAIEVSAGVALLPEPALAREVGAGTLVAIPLQGPKLVRPLGIIQRRQHRLSSTALRFLELLKKPAASDRVPEGPTKPSRHGRNGVIRDQAIS